MGFKEFIHLDSKKLFLLIILTLFAPLPMYLLVVVGLAPPISILVFAFQMLTSTSSPSPLLALISIGLFIIHILITYLLVCFLMWLLTKITKNNLAHWTILGVIALILIIISFGRIYPLGDVGGGRNICNLSEILRGFKCRIVPLLS